ncbi:MAG: hypothetical protein WBM90_00270 [Acidimicrobiia bacterium]
MSVTTRTRRGIGVGGAAFLIVAMLMAAMTVYILFVPVDTANFETTTGLSWSDFSSSNPKAAEYLIREARLLAIGFLGLSSMAAVVAWQAFHGDNHQASRPLLFFPLAMFGAGTVFIAGSDVVLGFTYLVGGAVAAVGLTLAMGRRRRST